MARRIWTIQLDGSHGALHAIPAKHSVYARNWERMYAAHKIRRIDMTTGEELATYSTRAFTSNLTFSSERNAIFANTDKRILMLDADDLSEVDRWESRVPKHMSSTLVIGDEFAMRRIDSDVVNVYDLNSKKVKRLIVDEGRKIREDINSNTFLACCESSGVVYRVDPQSRETKELFSGPPFASSAVDLQSKTMWLGERLLRGGLGDDYRALPGTKNRIHAFSLRTGKVLSQKTLKYQFKIFGLTRGAQQIWVGEETTENRCWIVPTVRVLDAKKDLQEVMRFDVPRDQLFFDANARAGLVFTIKITQKDKRWILPHEPCLLTCWKF